MHGGHKEKTTESWQCEVYIQQMTKFTTFHILVLLVASFVVAAEGLPVAKVDSSTLEGRVMTGYQTWFRCPGDASDVGWYHWSRDSSELRPDTLTFELWPDVSYYPKSDLFAAPNFTHPDGSQAYLYSSDNPVIVRQHFELLRDYGIDGVWLQRFVVSLPGFREPANDLALKRIASHRRIIDYIRSSATETGRVWAISYDVAGAPTDRIYDVLVENWKQMVDTGIVADDRYMKHEGKPVVQIWGFYGNNDHNKMTAELANQLIDFFEQPGKYQATLVGGGSWDWRHNPDPEWQTYYKRFKVFCIWNIGHTAFMPKTQIRVAATHYWEADREAAKQNGTMWIPTVYPGFSWDNLKKRNPGETLICRRKGEFLWEQFVKLAEMNQTSVYVSMLDEFDEGTAILPISNAPPTQAHFVGGDGVRPDLYLKIVGEGAKMIRGEIPFSKTIPFPVDGEKP